MTLGSDIIGADASRNMPTPYGDRAHLLLHWSQPVGGGSGRVAGPFFAPMEDPQIFGE
jgi:hypothetical protein